jgi:hypothetical protein
VPFLRFFIARSTYPEAPFEYLRAILVLPTQEILRLLLLLPASAGNDRV